ncbi:MAG: D-glycero-beta-D-manno-heptose 1-phosphate adenylyltransferase [Proteobacteria bacterium]|nr:D-glycero-beta-D-manno-heptose 1-phosphate adenylyltransferase [Pseudomonadota bacterium]MBU1688161.1 D-glycero-beta-D-manno-heptose 1-phosphate adenylyltransferase [Pseudomonadota bacterium]
MTDNKNDIGSLAAQALGFVQFDVRLGEVEHNLQQVRDGLDRLPDQDSALVALPELWAAGFHYGHLSEHAANTPQLLGELTTLASNHNIILAGSLPEADGESIYNTLFHVGPTGVIGRYRKQQLFSPMGENVHFTAGPSAPPVLTELGLVAGLVCFDLRFPELTRGQISLGAQLLVVSGQWPAARRHHWQILLQARAIENQVFVVGCNRCGTTDQTEFGGHSMVVGPDGTVLHEAGDTPENYLVPIETGQLARSRRLFTVAGCVPYQGMDDAKIVDRRELAVLAGRYRSLSRRIVFTNGCFDILHRGHVSYLEEARRRGDCLVVGVNSDRSVRSLKGPERPVNDELSRARVLAALGCVDQVVIFDTETPHELIIELSPDVLIKGGDWPVSEIVGAPEVLARGGHVISLPLVRDFSTTGLIGKIQERSKTLKKKREST